MKVQAQASLYVLRTERLSGPVNRFLDSLRQLNLKLEPGPMSTHITGDSEVLFAGLREAFEQAAKNTDVVLELKISNACPDKL